MPASLHCLDMVSAREVWNLRFLSFTESLGVRGKLRIWSSWFCCAVSWRGVSWDESAQECLWAPSLFLVGDLFMGKASELKLIRKKESHKMRVWWQDQLLLSYLGLEFTDFRCKKQSWFKTNKQVSAVFFFFLIFSCCYSHCVIWA